MPITLKKRADLLMQARKYRGAAEVLSVKNEMHALRSIGLYYTASELFRKAKYYNGARECREKARTLIEELVT